MSLLNSDGIASIRFLERQAASLLLYQSVLTNPIGEAFLNLLSSLRYNDSSSLVGLQAYGTWIRILAAHQTTWQHHLITQILRDENPFSQHAQKQAFTHLPPALIAAARHDLQILQILYDCSGDHLSRWMKTAAQLPHSPLVWHTETVVPPQEQPLYNTLQHQENWTDALEALASHYLQYGTGLFAESPALRWHSGQLIAIPHPDPVQLEELVGYEWQRDALLKNTEFLLAGYPALNVLLYGSRGSGKSSLVKSLVNRYRDRGLRLIEVAKSHLKELPLILELLRGVPQKFIIFVDDLSFEEDDDAFKALKVILEGNVTARPQNVIVYATSNRRHLIREFFEDRPRPKDSDEVHAWDTVQEKLSFSDRFGLTLTFEAADQTTYLTIVRHLAKHAKINLSADDLEYRALQWATRHNGRSGRTARQFVDFLQAELALVGQNNLATS